MGEQGRAELSVWGNKNPPNYYRITKHYNIHNKLKKNKTRKINTKRIKKKE